MDKDARKPLIVGNWKMHGTLGETIKLLTALKYQLIDQQHIEVVVAPPFTSLYSASVALSETHVGLAGQNLYWEDEGAFTGEVSGRFLKEVGCRYVIVGHSERRKLFGETNETVASKLQAALKNELIPIVCVGENESQRDKGEHVATVERQLSGAFSELTLHDFDQLVVAYEPVWAIGTGKTATAQQAGEMHQVIRDWLRKFFDAPTANRIRILYGGSVKPENAAELMAEHHVDGLLVGGASLKADSFTKIVKFEDKMTAH